MKIIRADVKKRRLKISLHNRIEAIEKVRKPCFVRKRLIPFINGVSMKSFLLNSFIARKKFIKFHKTTLMRKAITISLLLLLFTLSAISQPGSLNTSFGSSGFVTISFGDLEDYGYAMAIQPDGKIIATGSSNSSTTDYAFSLARLNPDGSLDNLFGSGGKVVTSIGISASEIFAVAIQSNGKIIAAGYSTQDFDIGTDFTIVRYNSDGTLDNSFGTGGIVLTDINTSEDQIYSITIQADGKILAAGPTRDLTTGITSFGVVRYNSDGSLDNSFGSAGKVITSISNNRDDAYKVLIASGNKIIVAGRSIPNGSPTTVAIVKYNSDGSLDNTFGNAGIVSAIDDFGPVTAALQNDGKIVVASSLDDNGTIDFGLARFNSDGTIDNSFGTGGVVSTNTGDSFGEILSLAIQTDGKIIAAGHSTDQGVHEITLARYNSDGSLDNTFGNNGIAKASINGDDIGYDIKLFNNKIFVVGSTTDSEGAIDMEVTSFNNDETYCNLQVSIPDALALPQGVQANTVYPGYSPASSITLTANVTGGNGFTYLWSNSSTSQSITVSPTTQTTYSVTITDGNNCTVTASKTISVIDVNCGNGKVAICHLTNDPNHPIDICVGQAAVASHLAQGCSLGDCSPTIAIRRNVPEGEQANSFGIKLYPNPGRNVFTIIAQTDNVNDKIEMRIIDVLGRTVETNKNITPNQLISLGQDLTSGIYFVELRQGSSKVVKKLVKL